MTSITLRSLAIGLLVGYSVILIAAHVLIPLYEKYQARVEAQEGARRYLQNVNCTAPSVRADREGDLVCAHKQRIVDQSAFVYALHDLMRDLSIFNANGALALGNVDISGIFWRLVLLLVLIAFVLCLGRGVTTAGRQYAQQHIEAYQLPTYMPPEAVPLIQHAAPIGYMTQPQRRPLSASVIEIA